MLAQNKKIIFEQNTNLCYKTNFDLKNIPLGYFTPQIVQGQQFQDILKSIKNNSKVFTKDGSEYWKIQVTKESIQENPKKKARSKTSKQFQFHTDHSFYSYPPQQLILYCVEPDANGGGLSQLISIETILQNLTQEQIEILKQPVFSFQIPQQFGSVLDQNQFYKKLPVFYQCPYTGINIRYRYDIIKQDLLSQQHKNAIRKLFKIVNSVTPIQIMLRKKQCMILNNGKFLHARTLIKDENRLLYRVMYNRRDAIRGIVNHRFVDAKFDSNLSSSVHKFKDILGIAQLPFSQKVFHNDSILFSKKFQGINKLQACIYRYFNTIVRLYSEQTRIGQYLRNLFQWPEHINQVIKELNKQKKFVLNFYRPDFILKQNQEDGTCSLKVCQINSRFTLNAFIISLLFNKLLNSKSQTVNHEIILQSIQKFFGTSGTQDIYFITQLKKLWDPILLSSMRQKANGKPLKFIAIKDLCQKNGFLYTSKGQRIQNVILQLKQQQIIELDIDIFKALVYNTNCLNDIRSIFICHDKRMLGLVHNEQIHQFLRKNYLQNTEVDFLRQHFIKTFNPGCQPQDVLQNKNNYVIKCPFRGKSVEIFYGKNTKAEQWKQKIQSKLFITQEYIKPLKLPIRTIYSNKMQMCGTVGTFLCFQDSCLGMGMFRCANKDSVCLSTDGFFLSSEIQTSAFKRYSYNMFQQTLKVKNHLLKKEEIKELACSRYKMNESMVMKKQHIREMQTSWKSKYISPSGGSSQTQVYVPNSIHENHYMRLALAEKLQYNNLLTDQDICLNLFGGMGLYRSKEIFNEYCQLCNSTTIPLGNTAQCEYIDEHIKHFSPNVIMGAPSYILKLVNHYRGKQLTNINKIFYAAQFLYDSQRQKILSVFPNAEFIGIFGSAQTGVWAYTFGEMQKHQIYYYLSDIIKIQVQDQDKQRVGQVLVTNLLRKQTPVYRFSMDDYVKIINNTTFKLVPKSKFTFFRMLNCDFQVNEIEPIFSECLNWQIILRSQTCSQMKVNLMVPQQNGEQIYMKAQEDFRQYVKQQTKKQTQGEDIKLSFELLKSDKELIRAQPSGKIYYIVDRRQ